MSKTARLEVRVEPEMLAAIDFARGDVPRARWIERAVELALGHGSIMEAQTSPVVRRVNVRNPSFNRATSLRRS